MCGGAGARRLHALPQHGQHGRQRPRVPWRGQQPKRSRPRARRGWCEWLTRRLSQRGQLRVGLVERSRHAPAALRPAEARHAHCLAASPAAARIAVRFRQGPMKMPPTSVPPPQPARQRPRSGPPCSPSEPVYAPPHPCRSRPKTLAWLTGRSRHCFNCRFAIGVLAPIYRGKPAPAHPRRNRRKAHIFAPRWARESPLVKIPPTWRERSASALLHATRLMP